MTREPARPWYREPMVWLVLALPLAAVVAGTATLVIAVRAGGSDAVPAEVRRSAQIQVADLAADARAAELGLAATLTIDADTGAIRVTVAPDLDAVTLRLLLIHPTRAREDLGLALTGSGNAWLGRIPAPDRGHDWLLRLEPGDGTWRLHGRLRAGTAVARLQPALVSM